MAQCSYKKYQVGILEQSSFRNFVQGSRHDAKGLDSPPDTPLSDARLIEGLHNGDEKAFEQMVQKFGRRLLATARRYLRSEDDACDALQDAFLCACKSISKFKGDSQLSTWLHRIVINSALMHLRARRQRSETAELQIDKLLPGFNSAGHSIDEGICTMPAHVSFEISETKAMVRRCIALLPNTYKIVVILRDIDELDTGEVASLLGLSSNNVKVRLHRARQALKILIERDLSV